jgi:DeoR/GlpR family transcriptional regulator of sugar metabolism
MIDLLKEERQQIILETLREKKRITVEELSLHFHVSEATIRRDLQKLAQEGKIRRAYREALDATAGNPESEVILRMDKDRASKEIIGRAAAALVGDGESIFLGSGSTTAFVAHHLQEHKNLTVITNALTIANELAKAKGVTVIVSGGLLRSPELSLIGHITEQSLSEVRVDKVILSIQAIHPEAGLTNDYLPQVMTDRKIIEMAPRLIMVADHTKFYKISSAFIAPLDRITTLVTDPQTDPAIINCLTERGIQVIVAGPNGKEVS